MVAAPKRKAMLTLYYLSIFIILHVSKMHLLQNFQQKSYFCLFLYFLSVQTVVKLVILKKI